MNINAESLTVNINSSELIVKTYDEVIEELRPDESWILVSLVKDLSNDVTNITFTRYGKMGM